MARTLQAPPITTAAALSLASVAAVALIQTALCFQLPLDGFWGPDPGVKLLQALNFSLGDQSIAYPAARIDADQRFPPFDTPFIFAHEGRFYGIYSPVYVGLAALLYRALGLAGPVLLSLVSTAVAMLIAVRLTRLVSPGLEPLAPVLIGLASPLLFYSLTFWEHAPGVALAAGALALLVSGLEAGGGPARLFAAGLLGGIGYTVRPELGVWCLSLFLVALILWPRRWLRLTVAFGGGAALVLGLFQLYELATFDTLVRRHVANNYEQLAGLSLLEQLERRRQIVETLLLPLFARPLWALLWLALGALALGYALLPQRLRPLLRLLVLLATAAMAVLLALRLPQQAALHDLTQTFPALCLLALLSTLPRRPLEPPARRLVSMLLASSALFTALVGLVSFNAGDSQWGPRYLLPLVVPLSVVLLGVGRRIDLARLGRATGLACAALLLAFAAISVVTQASGYRELQAQARMQSELNALVAALPERVVVVNTDLIAMVLSPIFYRKELMMVQEQAQVDELLRLLQSSDVREFAAVSLLITRDAEPPPTLDLRGDGCCATLRGEALHTYRRSYAERDVYIFLKVGHYAVAPGAGGR